jgi:hypothetical protein
VALKHTGETLSALVVAKPAGLRFGPPKKVGARERHSVQGVFMSNSHAPAEPMVESFSTSPQGARTTRPVRDSVYYQRQCERATQGMGFVNIDNVLVIKNDGLGR